MPAVLSERYDTCSSDSKSNTAKVNGTQCYSPTSTVIECLEIPINFDESKVRNISMIQTQMTL